MFPVRGWAVSEEALVSANRSEGLATKNPVSKSNARSNPKKRKREALALQSHSQVTADDLQKLWKAHVGPDAGVKEEYLSSSNKERRRKLSGFDSTPSTYDDPQAHCKTNNHEYRGSARDSTLPRENVEKGKRIPKRSKERHGSIASLEYGGGNQLQQSGDKDNGILRQGKGSKRKNEEVRSKPTSKEERLPQAIARLPKSQQTSERLTPLQEKMRGKLTSARFRHLNEMLYTSSSSDSLALFASSPDLFKEYHDGFSQQVKDSWPENPVDGYIRDLRARAQKNFGMGTQYSTQGTVPLPRRKTGSCTLADLGCGDAPLARALMSESRSLNLKFHNFDLHAPNSSVITADIANLPLRDGEADVALFCLSLMGTNWLSFIEEAWRILRGDGKGELWVAEVKSRFGRPVQNAKDSSIGSKGNRKKSLQRKGERTADDDVDLFSEDESRVSHTETDISAFVDVVQRRGFALQPNSVNKHNKMFVNMIFTKNDIPTAGKHQGLKWDGQEYKRMGAGKIGGRKKFIDKNPEHLSVLSPGEETKVLKPCVYKKR